MSEPADNTELGAFQAALARLAPAPDGINIAQLLFRAGQLSAPHRSWAWPCATAASMLLATALGSVFVLRPAPQPGGTGVSPVVERIVTVYVQPPAQPVPQPELAAPSTDEMPIPSPQPIAGEGSYLQLRREVLANGLDAMPPPTPWPAAAPAADTGVLLDLPPGSREPWLLRLKHSLQSGGPS